MAIIDGKAMSEKIRAEIKAKIAKLPRKPGLATVLVGENPASKVYVNMKNIACEKAGLHNEKIILDKDVSEEELIETIENLNSDPKIDGILVQLPLPKHIDENKVLQVVNPYKDVDGFHPISLGHLMSGNNTFVPCTPKGCMKLIESVTKIEGKNAVVVGRSNIVGKPIAQLLLQKNATVTICHSKTKDLPKVCKEADILVVAVGRPKLVTKDMVKKGAVVIDVGINRVEDDSKKGYHIEGDVDFENIKDVAAHITPVPKGVGPMTIAMLLENTLESCIRKLEDK